MAKKTANTEAVKKTPPGLTDPSTGSDGSSPLSSPSLGSAPTPAKAEAAAKIKPKAPAPAPEPPKPSVTLRVFQSLSGVKPSQFAGFMRFAQLEEMRPCPVAEWQQRYQDFLKRPTR